MLRLGRLIGRVARRNVSGARGSGAGPLPAPSIPRSAAPRAVALPEPDLRQLEAEARYHRDRLALYRARVLSAKPASAARLRELQRISEAANARLRNAASRDASDGPV